MKRVLTGPVHCRKTDTEYHGIFAVPLPHGRTGYLGIKADKSTGEVTMAIERPPTKPDATGHSGPEDDDDDGA